MFSKSGIIFNQTWEDFSVDKEALEFSNQDVFLTISSGGCSVLNAALEKPNKILAVDINPAQNNLLKLKIASLKKLSYGEFWQLFGEGKINNIDDIYSKIRENLDQPGQKYWDKNISIFNHGLYAQGKLASLALLRKWIISFCGRKAISDFIAPGSLEMQRKHYNRFLHPRLWNFISMYMPAVTMVIYGVHPRQAALSIRARRYFLKDIFMERLRHIFTSVAMDKNYFWHRILAGSYKNNGSCPAYLQPSSFKKLRKAADKIEVHDSSVIDFLKQQPEGSISKFNLSDVPEFLPPAQRAALWEEVIRTAKNKAILIYRSFSPGFMPRAPFDSRLRYCRKESEALVRREMTGSYEGFYKFIISK